MNETSTISGAELNTNETSAPPTNETAQTSAPKAPRAPKQNKGAPPKAPPLLKLSARQRSNVDALDNGAQTSASVPPTSRDRVDRTDSTDKPHVPMNSSSDRSTTSVRSAAT